MGDVAINIEGLSKRYLIGEKQNNSLRESLSNLFAKSKNKADFWALEDINCQINKGEAVGIIGANGAGKSTLLKILSRITYPTKGKATLEGRVASLLEVGTGFHPELTGRENIFLNGSLLGMKRSEIISKFDEIVSFSGIDKFIDTPVKRYSSGMYVRLAFSVAAHLNTEILLVDEVLAVGDYKFQQQCLGKMNEVANEGKTLLFVSHNLEAISSLCSKSILLENGRIKSNGSSHNIIADYIDNSRSAFTNNSIDFYRQSHRSQEVVFKEINVVQNVNDNILINLVLDSIINLDGALIEIHLYSERGVLLFQYYSSDNSVINIRKGSNKITFEMDSNALSSNRYFADFKIKTTKNVSALDYIERYPFLNFVSKINSTNDGLMQLNIKLEDVDYIS